MKLSITKQQFEELKAKGREDSVQILYMLDLDHAPVATIDQIPHVPITRKLKKQPIKAAKKPMMSSSTILGVVKGKTLHLSRKERIYYNACKTFLDVPKMRKDLNQFLRATLKADPSALSTYVSALVKKGALQTVMGTM